MPGLLLLAALLAFPGRASATVLTYVPSAGTGANDMGDLDHHYYYAWTLGLISVPTNEVITSAYITFTNMYNWDASKNVLFLDMFDTPATGGTVLVGPNTGNECRRRHLHFDGAVRVGSRRSRWLVAGDEHRGRIRLGERPHDQSEDRPDGAFVHGGRWQPA